MIKKFWRRFIYIIVIYSDAKGEFKHLIANLMAILLCIPFLYFIFVVIFNSKDYLYILMLAVILGRLFLAYIMERYKRDFGKGYTFFLRSISYTTLTLLFIGGSLKVIDDAKSNTNIQELIEKEYKHLKVENNNSNIQINENSNNSKYDYLLQNNK